MGVPTAEDSLRTLEDELQRGLSLFASASSLESLDEAETVVLGRKSPFSAVQRGLGTLSEEDRKRVGQRTNEARESLRAAAAARRAELEAARDEAILERDRIDVTLPGRKPRSGSLHPLTIVQDEVVDIFTRMGYQVVEGPEVESEWYNFDALNLPPDHPARTMMDTIYLDVPGHPELLLRTHTSPMQIRTMEVQQPPVYVVVPGRVFRNEEVTAKNMPVFHQVEGLAVDEGITFADLKGTLETFYRALLGPERQVRLRRGGLPYLRPHGLDRGRRSGHGPPGRAGERGIRLRALHGVRLRDGLRPAGHDPIRHPRYPPAVGERRPFPRAVRRPGVIK